MKHRTIEEKLDIVNKVNAMRKNGLHLRDAVKEFHVSESSYHKWIKELNGNPVTDVEALEAENRKLREILGRLLLERELEK